MRRRCVEAYSSPGPGPGTYRWADGDALRRRGWSRDHRDRVTGTLEVGQAPEDPTIESISPSASLVMQGLEGRLNMWKIDA